MIVSFIAYTDAELAAFASNRLQTGVVAAGERELAALARAVQS
jgi:hypothetical protein